MSASSQKANQILKVHTFEALATTPFQGEINAMCWERNLLGNFSEIVEKIECEGNMKEIDLEELRALNLSKEANLAREVLLTDFENLKKFGAAPILNLIKNYERDDSFPIFPTDVYSFHVDRSPIPSQTFLCTYYGEPSDILPNHEGIQKVLVPEIRKELKKIYAGPDEGFEEFLSEYFFDLHYQALPKANITSLGKGNLWKLAIDHPDNPVLPCLHRAPVEKDGEARLMIIC
ncbi:hypothetical protein [Brumimicrobium oceani]|uniref:DUF1826 domain-containing protein n=1 Tax=Brumimicrobium oceani TaxID=2100725 RepID=A0A2U2XHA4_9FLAO|nr:hypothetical protein [Brumimicrobium oceani]PWH87120.1 hypothetical protein DIT68_02330 [Brumimicrobium oceani]